MSQEGELDRLARRATLTKGSFRAPGNTPTGAHTTAAAQQPGVSRAVAVDAQVPVAGGAAVGRSFHRLPHLEATAEPSATTPIPD